MQLSLKLTKSRYKPSKSVYFDHLPIKNPNTLERYRANSRRYNPKTLVIYFLFDNNKLVYVGKTNLLSSRLRKHKFNGKIFDEYSFQVIPAEFEKMFILTFKPMLNIYSKNKS